MSELKVYETQGGPYELMTKDTHEIVEEDECYLKSEADRYIAHQKRKRCEAMAKICHLRFDRYELYVTKFKDCNIPSVQRWKFLKDHYNKWNLRWLELAEHYRRMENA